MKSRNAVGMGNGTGRVGRTVFVPESLIDGGTIVRIGGTSVPIRQTAAEATGRMIGPKDGSTEGIERLVRSAPGLEVRKLERREQPEDGVRFALAKPGQK
jgi:hypothetical protein